MRTLLSAGLSLILIVPACSSSSNGSGADAGAAGCTSDSDCKGSRVCKDGACVDPPDAGCTPACTGKKCGPDGCGSTCGTCPVGQTCGADGTCSITPGSVAPGGKCTVNADCDSSACTTKSLCVDEGSGPVCSCTCNWGSDCASGCCQPVKGSTDMVCAAKTFCKGLGAACTHQYECLNGVCGTEKSYCYDDGSGGSCGCGCSVGSDCASSCCLSYSGGGLSFRACSRAGACAPSCSTCTSDLDCASGYSCEWRFCDGDRACYPTAGGGSCDVIGGDYCPSSSAYATCVYDTDCGPHARCIRYTSGTGSYCRRYCTVDSDCPRSPSGYSSLTPTCDTKTSECYLKCSGPGTCPFGSSCLPYTDGSYGFCG